MKNLFIGMLFLCTITISNTYACSDTLAERSTTELKVENTRVSAIVGLTCGLGGIGVGVADIFLAVGETIPLIGGFFTGWELEGKEGVDEALLISDTIGGSLVGPLFNDVIFGPLRLGFDFIGNGYDGKHVKNFEYLRGLKNSYPVTQRKHNEAVAELIKNPASGCLKYRNQLKCIKEEQNKRSYLQSVAYSGELDKNTALISESNDQKGSESQRE